MTAVSRRDRPGIETAEPVSGSAVSAMIARFPD